MKTKILYLIDRNGDQYEETIRSMDLILQITE